MNLTSERLEVTEGEHLRMTAVLTESLVAIAAKGGLDHVRNALEDVGFTDVAIWAFKPGDWSRGNVPLTTGLEWPIWIEATPVRSASLRREPLEMLRIVEAWIAPADGALDIAPPGHPYATEPTETRRLVGLLFVFGVAYPLYEPEDETEARAA